MSKNKCNAFSLLTTYAYGRLVGNGDNGCGISDGVFQAGNNCGAIDKAGDNQADEKFVGRKPSYTDKMVDRHSQHMSEKGNIPLNHRPKVKNADGSISTVRSITIEKNGKHIVLPTVIGSAVVSDGEAIAHYEKTNKHLGIFKHAARANRFAEDLHKAQERDMKTQEHSEAKQALQSVSKGSPKKRTGKAERKQQILDKRKEIQVRVAQERTTKKQAYLERKRPQR